MIDVVAVIPTYNCARYVGEAIESALAQTKSCEVLVVDDGSTDDTRAALEPYRGRVTVLHQRNQGVAAARNAGVRASASQAVAFLDSDDAWLPDKLERQWALLCASPSIGLVHSGMVEVDGQGQPGRAHVVGRSGSVARDMLLWRGPHLVGLGSTALVRRALFDAVGGFDEALSTAADWDFGFRVASRAEVAFVEQPLVRYRVHGQNMHRNIARMDHDMCRAFEKAFADPALAPLRRQAYGRLHLVLSGSYLETREPRAALREAALALLSDPGLAPQVLGAPVRMLRRALGRAIAR